VRRREGEKEVLGLNKARPLFGIAPVPPRCTCMFMFLAIFLFPLSPTFDIPLRPSELLSIHLLMNFSAEKEALKASPLI
jgi:hypothetical protein